MYTIGEAAARSGISVPTLRAWERRYGVVSPARTESRYRLYDEAALSRLRHMRSLIDRGWRPREAAARVLSAAPATADARAAAFHDGDSATEAARWAGSLVDAAAAFDHETFGRLLDDAFMALSFESAIEGVVFPALREIGARWASGGLSVAAEHAASEAVRRRLAAAYDASARPRQPDVVAGLPAGAFHELGTLGFGVAAQRRGLRVLYLGADVPSDTWSSAVELSGATIAVIGVPTAADVDSGVQAVESVMSSAAGHVAVGGPFAAEVARRAGARLLPSDIAAAADAVRVLASRGG